MERFVIPAAPANPHNIVQQEGLRVSVLTTRLIRVETPPYTDYATQKVWHRDLGEVDYHTYTERGLLYIKTADAAFVLNAKGKLLFVQLGDRLISNFARGNLRGTARTLDNTFGAIRLGPGLVSTGGVTIMPDDSLLLVQDGVEQRAGGRDYYVFAYDRDYRANMRAFYAICGAVPLVPRYALGNWWSRYKAYTQQEYMDVIHRFESLRIPITVATIDMDWHWTDVIRRFGREAKPHPTPNFADRFLSTFQPGWTGYSWNTRLFPDYRAMLADLHKAGYHVTLNVHPSHGTRFFEDMYDQMCRAVGQDPATRAYVPFLLGDRRYLAAYFDVLHHPYEKEGVDFWWLDWQQGKRSDVPNLDPLWGLNHYHYLDSDRGETRPLILSRYAGDGSHRYPLGFSGDTCQNWASLRFQPYFTANATNAGYTWWSHDIGGHHWRGKNDQLYLRWVQFGIFSPIHRLHSSANEFMGKEPWKCGDVASAIIGGCMRLRHQLVPYIYTAAYCSHTEGVALCEPMYYAYPDAPQAYTVPNQYAFGSQLIVAPITAPRHRVTMRAGVRVWLPEGVYTDFFTGDRYRGGGYVTMYRDVASIPVLAREGAIVPMYLRDDANDVSTDQPYLLRLFAGEGTYTLYEDDGLTKAYTRGAFATTTFRQHPTDGGLTLTIAPAQGDLSVLPARRRYVVRVANLCAATATWNGTAVPMTDGDFVVDVDVATGGTLVLQQCVFRTPQPLREAVIEVLSSYQMNHGAKRRRFGPLLADPAAHICASQAILGPVREQLAILRHPECPSATCAPTAPADPAAPGGNGPTDTHRGNNQD